MVKHVSGMYILSAENPFIPGGKIIVEVVSLFVKGLEVLRLVDPVLNDEAQHHSTGFLGIDGHIPKSGSGEFFKDRGNYLMWK